MGDEKREIGGCLLFVDELSKSVKFCKSLTNNQTGVSLLMNFIHMLGQIFSRRSKSNYSWSWSEKLMRIALASIQHCVKKVRVWSFLVRISPHSYPIRRDTEYLSVFSSNAGKYGPEKLQILTLFTQYN